MKQKYVVAIVDENWGMNAMNQNMIRALIALKRQKLIVYEFRKMNECYVNDL